VTRAEAGPGAGCWSSETHTPDSCALYVKCVHGSQYTVTCEQLTPYQSGCTCSGTFADGSSTGARLDFADSATIACYASLARCGFANHELL